MLLGFFKIKDHSQKILLRNRYCLRIGLILSDKDVLCLISISCCFEGNAIECL